MRSLLSRVRPTRERPAVPQQRVPTSTGPDEATVRLARADFTRRRRAGRRRRWRTVALVVLAAAVVGGLAWLVLLSPYLLAERTTVAGAGHVGDARVERAADVPVGVPLARVDLDAVRDRVEAIPAVAGADVSRSWPHAVRVQVTLRTPVAAVAGAQVGEGQVRVVDAAGVGFDTPRAQAKGLPELRLADGLEGADAAEAQTEAGAVVAALPADLGQRVQVIDVASVDEVVLRLRSGRSVEWGSAEDSRTKAEVLDVLLDQVPRGVQVVDVSVPGRPTTR